MVRSRLRVQHALGIFSFACALSAWWLAAAPAHGAVVLWNTLDSQQAIENSAFGPNGLFLGGSFETGVCGDAYVVPSDYRGPGLAYFPKEAVPWDRGTLEFWGRLTGLPYAVIPWGQNPAWVYLENDGQGRFGIELNGNDGAGDGGLTGYGANQNTGSGWWFQDFTYEDVLGVGQAEAWHHYALVWDQDGIAGIGGGSRYAAVFVDGQLESGRWEGDGPPYPPLTGGQLGLLVQQYDSVLSGGTLAIDQLIIRDEAQTSFSMTCEPPVEPPAAPALWNKLGSAFEVMQSEVGPGGILHSPEGPVAFVPGQFGNGFTPEGRLAGIDFGSWEAVNPDYDQRGTIEFWWKPARDFDEDNSPPDEVFVSGVYTLPLPRPLQLLYRWREFTVTGLAGFDFQVQDETGVEHLLMTGKVVPFQAGEWVHVAFAWDVNGLPGHSDVSYGIYVDGVYYPLQDANVPGASLKFPMNRPDPSYLSLGYYTADSANRTHGVMDNVKIWNFAKEDFGDRFSEGPPGCGDSVVQVPEQCDDGNLTSRDGCSSSCTIEPPQCSDRIDNDFDGFIDFPADPGCKDAASREQRMCQDGIDNQGDGTIDFDGGASHNGGVPYAAPDPLCDAPWEEGESVSCGLGADLACVLPALVWLRNRRRRMPGGR